MQTKPESLTGDSGRDFNGVPFNVYVQEPSLPSLHIVEERQNKKQARKNAAKPNLLSGTLFSKLTPSPEVQSPTKGNPFGTTRKRIPFMDANGQMNELSSPIDELEEQERHFRLMAATPRMSCDSRKNSCHSPGLFAYLRRNSSLHSTRQPILPEVKATPVDAAVQRAIKVKHKMREDAVAGVPTEFSFGNHNIKIIHEGKFKRRKGRRLRQHCQSPAKASSEGSQSVASSARGTSRSNSAGTKSVSISGGYTFPKAKDFIPRESRMSDSRFTWDASKAGHFKQSDLKGRLCRQSYPVTEALHREGTSVTKLKGTVPDAFDVSKVWLRPMDKEDVHKMIPAEIARTDLQVTQEFKKKSKHEQKDKGAD